MSQDQKVTAFLRRAQTHVPSTVRERKSRSATDVAARQRGATEHERHAVRHASAPLLHHKAWAFALLHFHVSVIVRHRERSAVPARVEAEGWVSI